MNRGPAPQHRVDEEEQECAAPLLHSPLHRLGAPVAIWIILKSLDGAINTHFCEGGSHVYPLDFMGETCLLGEEGHTATFCNLSYLLGHEGLFDFSPTEECTPVNRVLIETRNDIKYVLQIIALI